MKDLDFVGQTLDGKYQMTRELGRGGMGTVYLATHLGTSLPTKTLNKLCPLHELRCDDLDGDRTLGA